ncbi:HNH endonuclease, partial [Gordonia sp. DT219]
TDIDLVTAHAADGSISAEHVDAIVRGLAHIDHRSPEPADPQTRFAQVSTLLSHYFAGATPADIRDHARTLGNQIA